MTQSIDSPNIQSLRNFVEDVVKITLIVSCQGTRANDKVIFESILKKVMNELLGNPPSGEKHSEKCKPVSECDADLNETNPRPQLFPQAPPPQKQQQKNNNNSRQPSVNIHKQPMTPVAIVPLATSSNENDNTYHTDNGDDGTNGFVSSKTKKPSELVSPVQRPISSHEIGVEVHDEKIPLPSVLLKRSKNPFSKTTPSKEIVSNAVPVVPLLAAQKEQELSSSAPTLKKKPARTMTQVESSSPVATNIKEPSLPQQKEPPQSLNVEDAVSLLKGDNPIKICMRLCVRGAKTGTVCGEKAVNFEEFSSEKDPQKRALVACKKCVALKVENPLLKHLVAQKKTLKDVITASAKQQAVAKKTGGKKKDEDEEFYDEKDDGVMSVESGIPENVKGVPILGETSGRGETSSLLANKTSKIEDAGDDVAKENTPFDNKEDNQKLNSSSEDNDDDDDDIEDHQTSKNENVKCDAHLEEIITATSSNTIPIPIPSSVKKLIDDGVIIKIGNMTDDSLGGDFILYETSETYCTDDKVIVVSIGNNQQTNPMIVGRIERNSLLYLQSVMGKPSAIFNALDELTTEETALDVLLDNEVTSYQYKLSGEVTVFM